jgi:NADH-quinone oxidoreductase subunit C
MEIQKVIDDLKNQFSEKIKDVSIQFGDEIVSVEKDSLLEIAEFLKKMPYDFAMLLDLTCVDYCDEDQRFEMVYHLFSLSNNKRIRLKARISEEDLSIESLTSLWKNANWLEREVFDMFGIEFLNHPDPRRLFMYDEFEGYPLRKDYPIRKEQPKIKLRK